MNATPPVTPVPVANPVQAPAVMILGGVGTGKSHCLVTAAKAGLDVFVIVTEPTGTDTLIDAFESAGVIGKLHYHQVTPSRKGFDDMLKQAKVLSLGDQELLSKQKPSGDRTKAKWFDLLSAMSNFVDQRGEVFGPIDALDDNALFCIDSLSGLNLMSMDITIGDKLTANPGEWGIAMNNLERLILKMTSDCKCFTVLTAHIDKEVDPISGAQKIMAGALGAKLAPKLPRFFSEVVHAVRDGDKFYWSTTTTNFDLKKRSLPLSDKLQPDFKPIIEAYRKRKAAATST